MISEDPIGLRGGMNLYQYAGGSPINFIDPSGMDKKNPFQCAAENADKVSLAGMAHSLGVPNGGVAGVATDALGGNAFSGLTNLATSFATGSGGGHGLGYNMALAMAAGPTQGFGPIAEAVMESQGSNVVMTTRFNGDVVAESSWVTSGPADLAGKALFGSLGNALESGGELTTLAGEASTAGLTGAVYASGVGEIKLAYDFLTYVGSFAGCEAGLL